MFRAIARMYFLQNLLGRLIALWAPPFLVHNLGKYLALKKAFYLAALENLEGDYLEFGVFTGSSLSCALFCARGTRVDKARQVTRFFGFDSFEGFGDIPPQDAHPFYTNQNFAADRQSVERRLKKVASRHQAVTLIPGYFSTTCRGVAPAKYGISRASVILMDNDTFSAALDCFRFCEEALQEGTVLIVDDYFSYRGAEDKGVCGAFHEWQRTSRRKMELRRVSDYGMGGVVFIVAKIQ